MFAQSKTRLHTLWQHWHQTKKFSPTTLAIGVSHEATQIHALQLRRQPDGSLSVQYHAHVPHLPLTATTWGLTQASLAAIAPLLPTPPPALIMALPDALVQHQYTQLNPAHLHMTPSEQMLWVVQQEVEPSTVAIDYLCLDDLTPDSSPLYLLCYTHQDAVDHYQNVTRNQALTLTCLDVEAFAALNAWYFWLQTCAPQHQDQVLMFIHARATDLSVSFCHKKRLLHQAHSPLTDTADETAWQQQTHEFIQQCWQRFHATHDLTVIQAYITGRHSTVPNLLLTLQQQLCVPLTPAHPVLALSISPPLHEDTLMRHAPDLLITFGLALRALDEYAP